MTTVHFNVFEKTGTSEGDRNKKDTFALFRLE